MLIKRFNIVGIGILIYILWQTTWAFAQNYVSPSYRVDETFVGEGGAIQSSSANYSGASAIGGIGGGEFSSTNYSSQSGYITPFEPRLAMTVTNSTLSLGSFSTSTTATGNSNFSVLNYTSYGYIVNIIGPPPSNGAHTLTGMNPTTASQVGVEQFGINLRANTSPTNFGADPVQVPSSNFSYGSAASGYDTPDQYRYVAGEAIAEATKSSGQTDYTISYIVNASSTTPGGAYRGEFTLVCTGTY